MCEQGEGDVDGFQESDHTEFFFFVSFFSVQCVKFERHEERRETGRQRQDQKGMREV